MQRRDIFDVCDPLCSIQVCSVVISSLEKMKRSFFSIHSCFVDFTVELYMVGPHILLFAGHEHESVSSLNKWTILFLTYEGTSSWESLSEILLTIPISILQCATWRSVVKHSQIDNEGSFSEVFWKFMALLTWKRKSNVERGNEGTHVTCIAVLINSWIDTRLSIHRPNHPLRIDRGINKNLSFSCRLYHMFPCSELCQWKFPLSLWRLRTRSFRLCS